jgi:hypothetical protein
MARSKRRNEATVAKAEEEALISSERAAEIALMDKIGLAEFTELTGRGVPGWGIYRISEQGVSPAAAERLEDWAPTEQFQIHRAARLLTLSFRCEPAEFMRWYNETKAKNGISDFALAKGFEETLEQHGRFAGNRATPSVTSAEIVSAFRVKSDRAANKNWWGVRLRNPHRYGLAHARAATGRARLPSRWFPVQVAAWLIDRNHLRREAVDRAMRDAFPAFDADILG